MGKLICGKNSVIEAIENNLPVVRLFLDRPPRFHIPSTIEVIVVDKNELSKMTKENHQGHIAELKEFNYYGIDSILKDKPQRVLVLDHIQDTHNLGAILRTANAAGINHVVIPKDRAAKITPTVLKIASGGQIGIKIIRVGSLVDLVQTLKKNNFWIYATSIDNAKPIEQVAFNDHAVIIVGNESKGVSRPLLKIADERVYIPMKGTVQSLNVSVATGIILFK